MSEKLLIEYDHRISSLANSLESISKKDSRYALIRLLLVIGGIGLSIYCFSLSTEIGFLVLVLIAILFLIIFKKHEKIKHKTEELTIKVAINNNEVNCLLNHRNEYYNGENFQDAEHDNINDLDVFGSYSIYNLINRCKTYYGHIFLSSHLSKLDALAEINSRKESVQEMAKMIEWRQDLATLLYNEPNEPHHNYVENLLDYLNEDFSIFQKPHLKLIINILPFLWILLLVLHLLNFSFIQPISIFLGIVTFILYFKFAKAIGEIQSTLSKGNNLLGIYGKAFQHVYNYKWSSQLMQDKVKSHDASHLAIESIFSLKKLMDQLDYRLNMIVGIGLNLFALWDFRVINKLYSWKKSHHSDIQELFETLGQAEAIMSLATWAYNHPAYTYASIDENHFHFAAEEMSHPLMINDTCVPNDFTLAQGEYANIITGSNMSGKSTILRTFGTNLILAFAGTVSSAKTMNTSHAQVVTYMRIKDALEENTSTFRAELNRVKLILQHIEAKEKCLFLIDEMLRGTNSKDKVKGSKAITKKIINNNAYAIIATHDIQLAEMSYEFPEVVKNYYFDIEFKGEELIFDYKIKPGICSNFNASFLLEQIGVK